MKNIKHIIFLILSGKISISNTLNFYFKSKTTNKRKLLSVIVNSRVLLTLTRNFIIEGTGKLFIGHDVGKFPRGTSSSLRMGNNAKIILNGRYSLLSGHQINIDDNAVLELGTGYLNHDAKITCKKSIKIGNNVIIGEDVRIMDSDSHIIEGLVNCKEIVIDDHVWIGIRCTILKGVHIGKGSVIAANSLVTKSIPENCLAGGVPAKVIKENITWIQ